MVSRVVVKREGVIVRVAIALAVEIAEKSQVSVQAQKEAVNAGTSFWCTSCLCCLGLIRACVHGSLFSV
jgi:hypothetical protein